MRDYDEWIENDIGSRCLSVNHGGRGMLANFFFRTLVKDR